MKIFKKTYTTNFLFLVILLSLFSTSFSENINIYTENSPPANYLNKDGELVGSVVDIVKEIQKRIGDNNPIKVIPWARGATTVK